MNNKAFYCSERVFVMGGSKHLNGEYFKINVAKSWKGIANYKSLSSNMLIEVPAVMITEFSNN